MAKEKETVEIPVSVLEQMQKRLDALEHKTRIQDEQLNRSSAYIIDPAYEALKVEMAKPASERTQAIADKMFSGPHRFRCHLDSTTEDGKPGPRIDEVFALEINAHSEEEAGARYLKVMGIRKHDYTPRNTLVGASA